MILYVENSKESTKQLLKLKANLTKSWIHVTTCTNLRHYSHYVKEARHKNIHDIWSHLYKSLEQARLYKGEKNGKDIALMEGINW